MKKDKFVLISPVYVANSILAMANNKKIKIDSVKLYNLIYLVYSDYLYHTQTKLFNEKFSPSCKGPILPSVYFKFNCYDDEEITEFASDAKGLIYAVHNNMLDSIISLNLDLYGYSFNEELIKLTNERSQIRNKFYYDTDILDDSKKRYLDDQKIYTLKLNQIENKK